jgi:cysteinyl-tRNA synthetase
LLAEKERLELELHEIMDRTSISSDVEQVTELSTYDDHPADLASETFEREKDLALEGNIQDLLDKVNTALEKIEDSTYGLCDSCGVEINTNRLDALLDDLNTPKAFAALHELRGEAAKGAKPAAACLKASAQLIGLLHMPAAAWVAFRPASLAIDESKIVNLIDARIAARKAKNFTEADRIRDELAAMGVVLKDSKDGTTWEIAR